MDKNHIHIVILIDTEKACDKIQFIIFYKNVQQTGIKENFFNLVKDIYEKAKANIISSFQFCCSVRSDSLRPHGLQQAAYFSPKIKKTTQMSILIFNVIFNIILEGLARAIRQENEIKVIQIEDKEIKLSLFTDDMIVCIENL